MFDGLFGSKKNQQETILCWFFGLALNAKFI